MNIFDGSLTSFAHGEDANLETLLLTLLAAFVIGQLNAWCYKWTHRGVSYSRTFTHALILITMISALTMSMVALNVIAAFGLLGGLAIIRYRTVVRDTRDTAYILLCLVCGMACGFGYFLMAAVGSIAANAVAVYLHQTGFGGWQSMQSLLRFQIETASLDRTLLDRLLHKYCRRVSLISVDDTPGTVEAGTRRYQCAYRLHLRHREWAANLVQELKTSFGISAVHLLVEQEHEEVA